MRRDGGSPQSQDFGRSLLLQQVFTGLALGYFYINSYLFSPDLCFTKVLVCLDLSVHVFAGMYGCVCYMFMCVGTVGHAGVEGFLSQDGHNGWRERLPRWQTEEGTTYTTTNNKRKTR